MKPVIILNVILWISLIHRSGLDITPGFMAYEDASIYFFHRNVPNETLSLLFPYPDYYPLYPLLVSYLVKGLTPIVQAIGYALAALLPAYCLFSHLWEIQRKQGWLIQIVSLFIGSYWLHVLEGNLYLNLSYCIWTGLLSSLLLAIRLDHGDRLSGAIVILHCVWILSNPMSIILLPLFFAVRSQRNLAISKSMALLSPLCALTALLGGHVEFSQFSSLSLGSKFSNQITFAFVLATLLFGILNKVNRTWIYLIVASLGFYLLSPRAFAFGIITGRYLIVPFFGSLLYWLVGWKVDGVRLRHSRGLLVLLLLPLLFYPFAFQAVYNRELNFLRNFHQIESISDQRNFESEGISQTNDSNRDNKTCLDWPNPWHFCIYTSSSTSTGLRK